MHGPTFLSLFAGIGGFDLALTKAGWRSFGQIELDPFCQRVLAARFPHAARWADVRQWQGDGHESVDLLVGGFPCQDFSVAGKRAGLVGYRGTLFWEIVRIAKELCPTWGLFENVPGLLSSYRGRDFWAVLQGLRECWPAVGWRVLDSRYFGVPQCRRRVFLVCGPSEESVASVLFESEGGAGHPAAGGETGANIAPCLDGSPYADREAEEGRLVTTLRHLGSGGPDGNEAQTGHLIIGPLGGGNDGIGRRSEDDPNLVVHGLTAEGADASEDGTGRGTPLVITPTLTAPDTRAKPIGGKRQDGSRTDKIPIVSLQTDSTPKWGDIGFTLKQPSPSGGGQPQAVFASTVRRLTPMECERLQAFPDGWTCLCQPLKAYVADPEEAAWQCKCPDGPRYRTLGNAVTVSVAEWIGRRFLRPE